MTNPYGQQGYPQQGYPGYQQHYGLPQPSQKPSSYLGWAIACIILFWPVAIAAIYNASQVNSAWQTGQYTEAQIRSEQAKMFCTVASCIGAGLVLVYVILFAAL